ncbi:MAG TPA: cupin domain-containing protein [Nevskiaceae bacterium]|nr:cupin domain-containing protein [Nevskiaceae bacterium]
MGINEEVKAIPATHVVHGSTADIAKDRWVPFEWEEPGLGRQAAGEIAVIRPFGTSGNLSAGFWRTGPTSPGGSKDGSHRIVYSAPLGDETACVLEGTATLTVKATGQKFRVAPGSVISSPKNLEVLWEIDGPYFKKYWCIFDSPRETLSPPRDLLVTNISDNPPEWQAYHFTEPKEGDLVAGELYFIRPGGSTGTMMSGVWRSGKNIPGSDVDANGKMVTPYTGVLGDETILLLEGEVDVVETLTGRRHSFRAGDVIGLSAGMHITWTSKGPFSKKLWVITRDQLPT